MLTPLDIHNKEFKRSLRGYDTNDVDEFLDEVIGDYEQIYRENLNLKEEIEGYKDGLAKYQDLEETLHKTLVVAQQAAEDVRKNAEQEAELIIAKARHLEENIVEQAEKKINDLRNEQQDLEKQLYQFKVQHKSFLLAQLELIAVDTKEWAEEIVENMGE